MAYTTEPYVFVVLGGTGDLMRRKLLPAIYRLREQGLLAPNSVVLGASLPDLSEDDYRAWARDALVSSGYRPVRDIEEWCRGSVSYVSVGRGEKADYQRLAKHLAELEHHRNLPGNRVFYLALPPAAFPSTLETLGEVGLNHSPGWTRVVVEKPFGHDLVSAHRLNALLHCYFEERQVYRIDHYLGKETVQNLLSFRFANPIFESLWNRDRIDSIQITVAEDLGVEHRGGYYDRAGALRDMVQNHLTQLMTVVAMEVPVTFEADAIHNERLKVLRAIPPIQEGDTVFGQYTAWTVKDQTIPGYREEPGVPPDSSTETYVAMKLHINNWRWQGVPFYLRTGKRLPRKLSQISVMFKEAPTRLFESVGVQRVEANLLLITLQPSEGFAFCFAVKTPGKPFQLSTHALHFDYERAFGPLPDAYQTLIHDIVVGDQTLFVRADLAEAAWRLYTPILERHLPVHSYTAGSWGPEEADRLLERDARRWQIGW